MNPTSREWLEPSMVMPAADFTTVEALVRAVAERMAGATATDSGRIEAAFAATLRSAGFSIGDGVAIPHVELESLATTRVCLVTVRTPLALETIDGRAPDVFLFILSKPDPHDHLLLLAHLARLAQSRTLVDGLRRARTAEEAMKLVHAAEQRYEGRSGRSPPPPSTPHALFVVSIEGERLVDALLIDLVRQGFGDACILEAQSLREAAAREVPLFAGFRDLFGDPGGRRVLILEAATDCTDAIVETVRRIAEEHRAKDARVSAIPIHTRWFMPPPVDEEAPGAH